MANDTSPFVLKQAQTAGASQELEHELEYMLAELTMGHESIHQSIQRFDLLVTFYLTGVTAIGGGIVIAMTSAAPGPAAPALAGVFLVIFAGFGSAMFLRLGFR